MDILRPVSNRWREIGTALLLKTFSLDDFESNHELVKEGPEGFLRETLNTVEHLTVRALASALRSPSLQEEEIALLLEEHFLVQKGIDISMYIYLFSGCLLISGASETEVGREIATLSHSFESLKTTVLKELDAMKVTVTQLREAVVSVYPKKAIPKSIMTEMQVTPCSQDLFTVITRHGMWNYINHHLLKCMVEKIVPQNNQLQNEIEVHKAKVESFFQKTPIHDYIDSCSQSASGKTANLMPVHEVPPDPAMFVPHRLTLRDKLTSQSLGLILRLQNCLMEQFSLPHPTLLFGAVHMGSIVITFYYPHVELERVRSLANSSSSFLSELNVKSVTNHNELQYQNESLTLAMLEVPSTSFSLRIVYILVLFIHPGQSKWE